MGLPSAYAVALLTALNIKKYSDEKSKGISRFRMSRQTLRALSKRQLFRHTFLGEYEEHLSVLGWLFFEMPDGSYAFLETVSVDSWTKIASTRVSKEIAGLAQGNLSDEDIEAMLDLGNDSDSEESDN
jgi:hypothetical protein